MNSTLLEHCYIFLSTGGEGGRPRPRRLAGEPPLRGRQGDGEGVLFLPHITAPEVADGVLDDVGLHLMKNMQKRQKNQMSICLIVLPKNAQQKKIKK